MTIKIFGDTLNDLLKILFINKAEFVEKLGISMDTCENWLKGKNTPNYGNSGSTKNITVQKIIKAFEEQYHKRLNRGMLDEELLKSLLVKLPLPDDTKNYLETYVLKDEFVQMVIESAYEYHKIVTNKAEYHWKKAIEIYSDNYHKDNMIKIRLYMGDRCLNVSTDTLITLKRLIDGVIAELAGRDLLDDMEEIKKEYYLKILDKNKKIQFKKADNNTYLKEIEENGYEKLEILEHTGATTIIINGNIESEKIVYPFMERIFENEPGDSDESNSKAFNEIVAISKSNFVVGRKSEFSDYVIPNNFIGRIHAQICIENGRYYIKDLGSVNGTFVNEEKLQPSEKREIFSNDIIGFVNFKYSFIVPEN